MIDLIFFSTNLTKINHFIYLGKKHNLTVKSFRELNYYASYVEPRIDDRAELLRRSYDSALAQWQRRQGRNEESGMTFFFEDTSVRIEALSSEVEVPGVNIKFWMREHSFSQLDQKLKEAGNDRRASVRSDIIMHLPKKWKELLGINEDYVWVYAIVPGRIVMSDQVVDLNLIYPWLDDKSFNRWFIPEGSDKPLSSLGISEADKFDFRKLAFDKILAVLNKLHLIQTVDPSPSTQLVLPKIDILPSVFLICGPTCAGKSTSAAWLAEQYRIPHIEASDFMYRAFWQRHGLRSKKKIGDFAEAALETEPDIVAGQIVQHIENHRYGCVVITGFRSLGELDIFKKGLSINRKIELIYLDANDEVRLQRAMLRGRDGVTPEKFVIRNAQEERMGLLAISRYPGVVNILNNGTLSSLFETFRRRYGGVLRRQELTERMIKSPQNLESFIIGTLSDFFNSNIWLTTTEIAAELNKKYLQSKSKNNISRYFNQGFHVYFVARLRTIEGSETKTVEYQLSLTGVSEARLINDAFRSFRSPQKRKSNFQSQLKLFEDD